MALSLGSGPQGSARQRESRSGVGGVVGEVAGRGWIPRPAGRPSARHRVKSRKGASSTNQRQDGVHRVPGPAQRRHAPRSFPPRSVVSSLGPPRSRSPGSLAPERLRPPRIGGRRRCLQPMSGFATQRQTPARRAAKAVASAAAFVFVVLWVGTAGDCASTADGSAFFARPFSTVLPGAPGRSAPASARRAPCVRLFLVAKGPQLPATCRARR